jgi:hypothetical protein
MRRTAALLAATLACGCDDGRSGAFDPRPSPSLSRPIWLEPWTAAPPDEAAWLRFEDPRTTPPFASVLDTGADMESRVYGRRLVAPREPTDAATRAAAARLLSTVAQTLDEPFDDPFLEAEPLLLLLGERALLLFFGPEDGRVRATRGDGKTYVFLGDEAFAQTATELLSRSPGRRGR